MTTRSRLFLDEHTVDDLVPTMLLGNGQEVGNGGRTLDCIAQGKFDISGTPKLRKSAASNYGVNRSTVLRSPFALTPPIANSRPCASIAQSRPNRATDIGGPVVQVELLTLRRWRSAEWPEPVLVWPPTARMRPSGV